MLFKPKMFVNYVIEHICDKGLHALGNQVFTRSCVGHDPLSLVVTHKLQKGMNIGHANLWKGQSLLL